MKILKISGRNLASLAGDFCVDFEQEPLASSGLFAISGPTGAGKSTLLDALCLALYDATPRLLKVGRGGTYLPDVGADTVSAQDPRTLLRRGAAEAHAEVDFVGNDQLRYRARWSVRRSRGKAGGGLQKSAMTLHRLPELIAIGGTKTEVADEIAQRVGLSFEQFTRAVLLAQNEFSAFLKTEENERGELLETLTGSAIYSAISRRAFERYKAEQSAMQQLAARLADHTPLAVEARAGLEAQCAAADEQFKLAQRRSGELEQQLRWHQEAARLAHSQAQAEEALVLARAAADDAAGRRRRLDTVEAVQPARQLLAECTRLERDIAQGRKAIDSAAEELKLATAAQAAADAALAAATLRRQAAEQSQRAAGPQLDQAKALDASLAALAPSHAKATQALLVTQQELAAAAQALHDISAELAGAGAARQAAAGWLARHPQREQLAAQWPRWETLLLQAEQAASRNTQAAVQLEAAHTTLQTAAAAEQKAAAALAQASGQLAMLETARQNAIAALAAFDGEQLRRRRAALDERRDALMAAEKTWTGLSSIRSRLAHAGEQVASLEAAKAGAAGALEAAGAQAAELNAALAQAERSLQAAEIACADSVVDLRATLEEGEPCPVCGSEAHPYRNQSAVLDNVLASLRAQLAQCRAQVQDNLSMQASQRALLASSEQQLAAAGRESEALQAAQAVAAQAWLAASPIVQGQDEATLAAWLAGELQALKTAAMELDSTESAARAASATRDSAQHACDQSTAAHARHLEQANNARAALAKAQATHASLADQRAQSAERLAALLGELDSAFGSGTQWKNAWQALPAAFRSAREAEVRQWREQSAQHTAMGASIAALEAQLAATTQRHAQAQGLYAAANEEFARVDTVIGAKKTERASLWDGRPVSDIERELGAALDAARADAAGEQAAALLAVQRDTRARESVAHNAARLESLQVHALEATGQLDAWLAGYAKRHAALEPVAGKPGLEALLGLERDWLAAERSALQAIDAAAASAATVLAERCSQRELHQQSAPPGTASDAASLAAEVEAAAAQRTLAADAVGALRLQLAQDDVRRASAAAMMAEIDKQQLVELRWGRMNELIGSADGKKFRNYAQQFTLDVLLGYANSHLSALARRYRLERVVATAGPSLGLQVRDQDMGGEIRSVNSLSGGESFLVSLALALGLASLSSNRVRVESLFIDEGFGSLDADTLRVAMDALDGLQSMGRKVGVISHVQEMTERIATRILVQPSGGGTSSVTVQ